MLSCSSIDKAREGSLSHLMTGEQPARYRGVLALALGPVSVAIAAWLVPASVHVVGWQGDAARRVVLLAPFPSLAVSLLVAAAVVLGLVVWLPTATGRYRSFLFSLITSRWS